MAVRHALASGRRLLCTAARGAHPRVDIAALKRGEPGAVGDLRSALLDHGYFYCANVVEIPSEYIRSIYAYSRRVHALPSEVKRKYAQRGGTGSYSGPDIGQHELQYEADGQVATVSGWDYSRARFSLGVSGYEGDARYPSADELTPRFAEVLDELYSKQDGLARVLLGGLGGPRTTSTA